jgi:hypothetical protein
MEPKYSALDLLRLYQEKREVLKDYSWEQLVTALAHDELAYWKSQRVCVTCEDPKCPGDYTHFEDPGSAYDQMASDMEVN